MILLLDNLRSRFGLSSFDLLLLHLLGFDLLVWWTAVETHINIPLSQLLIVLSLQERKCRKRNSIFSAQPDRAIDLIQLIPTDKIC